MHKFTASVALATLTAAVGCGGSSSPQDRRETTASVAAAWDAHINDWRTELLSAAAADSARFPPPSPEEFSRRLTQAARRFEFRVLRTDFVRAPQGSPLVIVEATLPAELSRDTLAIVRLLNPRPPEEGTDDWKGWDYEGLFFGAQDAQGSPFLAVFQFWRAPGGGQWARTEDLYPFKHLKHRRG